MGARHGQSLKLLHHQVTMSAKLPPEFDPERYSAAHPDVSLSGLSPQDHYLRFGRLLGRDPRGRGVSAKSVPSEKAAPPLAPQKSAPPEVATAKKIAVSEPIVDRPRDFSPSGLIPIPAASRPGAGKDNSFSLDVIAQGPFASSEERDRIARPLIAYARMLSFEAPGDVPLSSEPNACGSALFQSGETRLENMWFAEPEIIRMMIRGGSKAQARTSGWSVRAYQAEPGTPDRLKMAGQGLQLPPEGPVFFDVSLVDPLMPILLELSDEAGVIRALTLLPFPSLLAGGLHHTELRALQCEANPIDAFWSLSGMLLEEMLGTSGSPPRSITALSSATSEADEPALPSELTGWLEALFGLPIGNSSGGAKPEGIRMDLPASSIPTISALVSRRLDLGGAEALTGPFLICDASNKRPRWSVAVPPDQGAGADVPLLRQNAPGRRTRKKTGAIPIYLAIVPRPPHSGSARPRTEGYSPLPTPLTVFLETRDPEHAAELLPKLQALSGEAGLDLLVRPGGENVGPVRDLLNEVIGAERWRAVERGDIKELAALARYEFMLTLSDRVKFDGSEAISKLFEVIQEDETIASVGCALMGEASLKSHSVARPVYAGLFPSRVSFATSPHLAFYEPDVGDSLSNSTYPVIANNSLLALWRTGTLASLPRPTGPVPTRAADIQIGLEVMKTGHRNLCTTKTSAELRGPYVPRDTIDPLGSTNLEPGSWESIISRVTLLRELF